MKLHKWSDIRSNTHTPLTAEEINKQLEEEDLIQQKKDELFECCSKFIEDNKISCPESIFQRDCVVENSLDLIENICKIMGYYKYIDD